MRTPEQVNEIISRLEDEYPLAECTLDFRKDYELLFSVRLAAQCTDERVNKITPALFERFPTLESFAGADVQEVEKYIHSCGFFRAKARDIVLCAQALIEKHGGRVPDTMEELVKLPGVGRKTANLILGDVFGKPAVVVSNTPFEEISVPRNAETVIITFATSPENIRVTAGVLFGRITPEGRMPVANGCV